MDTFYHFGSHGTPAWPSSVAGEEKKTSPAPELSFLRRADNEYIFTTLDNATIIHEPNHCINTQPSYIN
jgi:hypothetical protein